MYQTNTLEEESNLFKTKEDFSIAVTISLSQMALPCTQQRVSKLPVFCGREGNTVGEPSHRFAADSYIYFYAFSKYCN